MADFSNALAFFAAGVLFQSIMMIFPLLLRRATRKDFYQVIIWCILGVLGMLLRRYIDIQYDGIDSHPVNIYEAIFLGYMVGYTLAASKTVLPVINGKSLITFNAIFLFNCFYVFHFFPIINMGDISLSKIPQLMAILLPSVTAILLPSFLVIINVFSRLKHSSGIKSLFYLWYLTMASIMLFNIIHGSILFDIFDPSASKNINWSSSFSVGLITASLVIDLISIYAFIRGLFEVNSVENQIDLFGSKFQDEVINTLELVIFITVVLGALLINYYYIGVDQWIAISLAVVISRLFSGSYFSSNSTAKYSCDKGNGSSKSVLSM